MSNTINRRKFIKKSAIGLTFLPFLSHKVAASDRIRIAHIGLGGMGNNHMNWFSNLPEAEIVALCDLDKNHLNSTYQSLKQLQPGTKAEQMGAGNPGTIFAGNALVRYWPAHRIQ